MVGQPGTVHGGETEARRLKDGPEIPADEHEQDRNNGRDSAAGVKATVAEEEASM